MPYDHCPYELDENKVTEYVRSNPVDHKPLGYSRLKSLLATIK